MLLLNDGLAVRDYTHSHVSLLQCCMSTSIEVLQADDPLGR